MRQSAFVVFCLRGGGGKCILGVRMMSAVCQVYAGLVKLGRCQVSQLEEIESGADAHPSKRLVAFEIFNQTDQGT